MLRILLLGIMGMLVSAFGVVAYVGLRAGHSQAALPPPRTVSVIVAAHAVSAGNLLQPGDLASRSMPEPAEPPGASLDTAEDRAAMVGAMVRHTLAAGDVVGGDDVLRPGDRGFLAAVLDAGTRAVSVAVDAVSGEAGLIWPGDRVDVILTQTIDTADQSPAHRVSGETVLADVRVIAVDQQLVQGGQAAGLIEQRVPNSRTITLEVTPRDAARIAVATRLGKLQVVLRAAEPDAPAAAAPAEGKPQPGAAPFPADSTRTATAAGGGTVWGGDVSAALGHGPGRTTDMAVRLFQGTRRVEEYRF